MPDVSEDEILDYTTFDCDSKKDLWSNPDWYIFNPKSNRCNFFSLGSFGAFAFDQAVYDSDLFTCLEMAGEIIPIKLPELDLYIMNVRVCVNALNDGASSWIYYPNGGRSRVKDYVFHADRITESSLFKIPETSKGEILTYTGVKHEDDEFKSLYEKLGFTGLTFTELYKKQA